MTSFMLSQLLAGLAFGLDLAAFQFARRHLSLTMLAASTSLLALHFWLLAEPGAAGMMALAACRYLTAIVTRRRRWMWGFIAMIGLCGGLTWQSLLSGLPLAGSLLMTVAAFQHHASTLRLLTLFGSACWLLNNYLIGSPMAVLMEGAFMLSTFHSWWRLNRQALAAS